ncbi:ATP-binding cassette domain-containing protein [Streptomyces sp. CB03238]|uniref:ABC transporter ATP-binding protein n=1 Tax=Streptomyces sp. CB03238 TaxID=1907777 RepID=UPI000A0FE0DC|nr:ATP-binding cassette domain-containing protein [Streptomyces sp. CB03238]ORT58890.1 hypothetical protein BKD26_17145 [Streptomyces sp. CB03238]
MRASPAIEATGLRKAYNDVLVLDGIDLRVERGTVHALLGPNGAGKTTTVRILATLTRADAGQARVAGYDVVADRPRVRRAISLTGQFAAVDDMQTGEENLRMMARLSGLSRAAAARRTDELLERFRLTDARNRLAATYSGCMRRRLDLAAGLVGDPDVVFLDEPTTPDTLTLGIPTDGTAAHVRALLDELDPGRTDIARFSLHSATLDDVFLALTAPTRQEPTRV